MKQPSPDPQNRLFGRPLARTAIVCDFDDTTADRNVATLLLEAFHSHDGSEAAPHWRDTQKRFAAAEITLAEYQEITFSQMTATREEQAHYARNNAALRPGFPELTAFCSQHGVEVAIVSHGLDFYVTAVLQKAGVGHLPVYAVETGESPTGQPTFAYRFASAGCAWAPGNCKCSVVDRFKKRGLRVLYAGDGASDACPARRADFVFARDSLLRACREEGLAHRELTDFHVVLEYLREQDTEVA